MKIYGPLGSHYIPFAYIMEGDTPSFLGLINNGLGWAVSPAWGGWGGRYEFYQSYAEKGKIWTSSVNTQDEITLVDGRKEASNQATVWRWREAYQHDFAARMDWNVSKEYGQANHHPVLTLNGNTGKAVARASIKAGEKVVLSAKGSTDPDGNQLIYKWFVYPEAGSFSGKLPLPRPSEETLSFSMPLLREGESLHLILEVRDTGIPSLISYRRVVLTHP